MIDIQQIANQIEGAFGIHVDVRLPELRQDFADWQVVSAILQAIVVGQDQQAPIRVIGISGSQGSGKSSLAQSLVNVVNDTDCHRTAATCSLDDFYLTKLQRVALADDIHPLLATRGVPGTHDWRWLNQIVQEARRGPFSLEVPVFDKGMDDRQGILELQADLLILEGWCLGVQAQPESMLAEPVNQLERDLDSTQTWRRWVNQMIAAHYHDIWQHVDFWVHLRVPSVAQVVQWRTEQERQLPPDRQMTPAQLVDFVAHYERLTRWQWTSPALGPGMIISIDEKHQIVDIQVKNERWM